MTTANDLSTDWSNQDISETSASTKKMEVLEPPFTLWALSLFAASVGFLWGFVWVNPFGYTDIINSPGIFLSASPVAQLKILLRSQFFSGVFAFVGCVIRCLIFGQNDDWLTAVITGPYLCILTFFGTLAIISMAGAALLMHANPAYTWTDYIVVFYIAASLFSMYLYRCFLHDAVQEIAGYYGRERKYILTPKRIF